MRERFYVNFYPVNGDLFMDDYEDDEIVELTDAELIPPHERRRLQQRDDKMLTPAEASFIQAYMETGNITEAKKLAGLPPGSTVHKRRHVRNRVHELFDDAITQSGITPDKILHELGRIAFANIDDFIDDDFEMVTQKPTRARMAAVESVEVRTDLGDDETGRLPSRTVKIKMYSKLKALETLGRHFNMFTDMKVTLDISDRLKRAEQKALSNEQ